jgi:hypothetical protein
MAKWMADIAQGSLKYVKNVNGGRSQIFHVSKAIPVTARGGI